MRHQSESERFVSRSWDNWYLIHFKVNHPSEACEVILNVIKRSKVVLLFSGNHPVTAWLCNPVWCLSKLICSSFPNRRTPVLSHSCSNLESGFSKLFSLVYTAIRWVWQGLHQPLTKSKKSPQLPKFQNHHFGNQFFPKKKKQWGKNIIHAPISSTCRPSPQERPDNWPYHVRRRPRALDWHGRQLHPDPLPPQPRKCRHHKEIFTTWVRNGMVKIPRYWGLLFCT